MRKAAILTTVVLVTVLVGGVALATAGPEIDDVSGTWSLAPSPFTTVQCTGEDGGTYSLATTVDTGLVSGTGADFALSGTVTLTMSAMVNDSTNEQTVSAPFTLRQDNTHRLMGKLQAVGQAGANGIARGWITGTEQRKTTTGWVNTPDHLWANVEFEQTLFSATIWFGQSQGPDPSNLNIGLVAAETTQKTC
jgi:hypothetical protein